MWIKDCKKLEHSGHENVNFLYKHNKIYVMDNHLCAAWCWMNSTNVKHSHNFIHIDRHYDLLGFPNTMKNEIIDKDIKLEKLTFLEFLALKQIHKNQEYPMFRWDNYIINLQLVFPNYFNNKYFTTQREGKYLKNFVNEQIEFFDLLKNMNSWFFEFPKYRWIINLDIDFFFCRIDEKLFQVFSDDSIIVLANILKELLPNIKSLTIALSPECCGGWSISFRIMKIFSEVLNLSFSKEIEAKFGGNYL